MTKAREQYIKAHTEDVVNALRGTGLFPQVALMQGAIESNDGSSLLANSYNNYYGIKASPDWNGDTITLRTGEYVNGKKITVDGKFRVYGSFYESTKDYVEFLKKFPRYTDVFKAKTPQAQAKALQEAGYATAPSYSSTIISSIKANSKILEKKLAEYLTSPTDALIILGSIGLIIYGGYHYWKMKK